MITDRAEPQQPSLKPCPFCGSAAIRGRGDIPAVECSNRGCGATLHMFHAVDGWRNWNCRASPAPDPQQPSDDDRKQVVAQYHVVAALAETIASVHRQLAETYASAGPDSMLDMLGARSAELMDELGDIVNGMDAATEEDAWMDPIFERAKVRWPIASPAPDPAQEAAPVAIVHKTMLHNCGTYGVRYEPYNWDYKLPFGETKLYASPPAAPVAKQINEDDYVDIPSHDSFDPPPIDRIAATDTPASAVAEPVWRDDIDEAPNGSIVGRLANGRLYWAAAAKRGNGPLRCLWYTLGGSGLGEPNVWLAAPPPIARSAADDGARDLREIDRVIEQLKDAILLGRPSLMVPKLRHYMTELATRSPPVSSQQSGSGEATVSEKMLQRAMNAYHTYDAEMYEPKRIPMHAAIEAALAAQSSPPASGVECPEVSPGVSYELIQNDGWCAEADAFSDALHYAIQYAQDGPIELYKVTREKVNLAKFANDFNSLAASSDTQARVGDGA